MAIKIPARPMDDPDRAAALTQAGRIADEYTAQARASFHDALRAMPPANGPAAKPSKARTRAALQQAALGTRLAQEGRLQPAVAAFRRSIELDASVAEVHHNLGFACLRAGLVHDAVAALTEAVRLKPHLASAQAYLAAALDQLGRTAEALVAYEAVVRLEPRRQAAQYRLGQLCLAHDRRADAATAFRAAAAGEDRLLARVSDACAWRAEGDDAAAVALLRAVVADAPEYATGHVVLGEMLAEIGDTAEAAERLEHAVRLDPAEAGAWVRLAAYRKFTPGDTELMARMAAMLEHAEASHAQRRAVHFALGKACDDLGRYAEAMRHFDAGNRIRGAAEAFDRAGLVRRIDWMIEATPPGFLDRMPRLGVADATPVLIVGMPRSGTTLVEQVLASHPQVAAGGELRFWGEKALAGVRIFSPAVAPVMARRVADEYLAVLRGISPDAARVTDKMPFNFEWLGLIRQVFPNATIVHCRRDPIDTCLSIYMTDFTSSMPFAADRGDLALHYREYRRLMAHWRRVLPADRFIDVDYEALVADPEHEAPMLIAACGLPWNDACLAPHRARRRISTASVWQARQPIYQTSVARWRRYEPWLGELRALLSDGEA